MDKKYYYIIGGVLVLLMILLGVLFLVPSKKSPATTPVGSGNLVWWMTFEDQQNLQDLITDYQNAHKGVNITFVKKDATTYEQDLVNALAAGTGPDIFAIHNDWLQIG